MNDQGQGANQALLDAVLLARGLYQGFLAEGKTKSLDLHAIPTVLGECEANMLTRSSAKVEASAQAARFLHSKAAVEEGNRPRGGEFRDPVTPI
jgi:hypothetical protein